MSDPQILVWLLLQDGDTILLTKRKLMDGPFTGEWTLPGDLMGEYESASEVIARVCRDHLGVQVSNEHFLETLTLHEAGIEYAVNVFGLSYQGRPRYRESGPYAEATWVAQGSMPSPMQEELSAMLKTLLAATARL